ncbi:MAG: four helix bundle protein, partial [Prevotella sp.]|nr:four helix bundle protein [Prevotella sp.]
NKLSIALKEANETEFWLKSLYQGEFIDEKGFQSMFNDNEEIIKILVKSIKTVRSNSNDE